MCYTQRHPWFAQMYRDARREQSDFLAQDNMRLGEELMRVSEPSMPWVEHESSWKYRAVRFQDVQERLGR